MDFSPFECSETVSQCLKWFRTKKLLPAHVGCGTLNVRQALDLIEEGGKAKHWECERCHGKIATMLRELKEKWEGMRGFCLDCVNTPRGVTPTVACCRISHSEPLGLKNTKELFAKRDKNLVLTEDKTLFPFMPRKRQRTK